MANSLDDVVSGALRVLDQYGLEFCSMRRVAGELGVQPSALYHHVPDKQTLLALMADRIVADVEVGADPQKAALALREAMMAVRDGADVVATASAFRLGDSRIENELAAITSPDVARTLLLYVFGHTQATQMHRQAAQVGIVAEDPDLDASFARGLALILR
ncbi:TetR family transcriptional regulator [Aeromicrobium senzhongii]|uniref:TetR family transcriptional regulator n=1 Tax=Aeromicrobium senzhongii TaxID=2663859 RepID=A0ABX6SVU8_9ACTN|nr:TetR family transcriptional regulator [Aeromicrobium senzhongii]MTB88469.1 TetR family transcriptional regulator [Aeromicrobium senzhongii]QNL94569.1 TetR family transcriptional regulator [Aeromicrobium senzhongii]